jgi:MinD-like ATPase involved in chromosome partitioning or flagellar assembly
MSTAHRTRSFTVGEMEPLTKGRDNSTLTGQETPVDLDKHNAVTPPPVTELAASPALPTTEVASRKARSQSNMNKLNSEETKKSKSATVKAAKPRRFTPISPPSRGFRGFIWKFGGKRLYEWGMFAWLATPSLRERETKADNGIWALRKNQKIWAFMNSTGKAGKTQAADCFAVIAAVVLRRHVIAMDLNESPGATAKRLGIDRADTLELRPFLAMCDDLTSLSEFSDKVAWQPDSGVSVIASAKASNEPLDFNKVGKGISTAKSNGHHLMLDFGNVILAQGNLAGIHAADVLTIPCSFTNKDSLDDVVSTMELYAKLGYEHKVNKAIILVFGDSPRRRSHYARLFSLPIGQIFVIPSDRWMLDSKVIDLTKFRRASRVALKEAFLAGLALTKPDPAQNPASPKVHVLSTSTTDIAPAASGNPSATSS